MSSSPGPMAAKGGWELRDGVPVAMSPERVAHVETKFSAGSAMKAAIKEAGLRCEALLDGLAIRVDQHNLSAGHHRLLRAQAYAGRNGGA